MSECTSWYYGIRCDLEPWEHERDDWHQHTTSSGARHEWDDESATEEES